VKFACACASFPKTQHIRVNVKLLLHSKRGSDGIHIVPAHTIIIDAAAPGINQ
jgi:hypothetical protein